MSTQRRSATKRKQSGKRSGRSAQPAPQGVQNASVAQPSAASASTAGPTSERRPSTAASTSEPRPSTAASTSERRPGTTITYRPREAPEVVTNGAVLPEPSSVPAAAVNRTARTERASNRRKPVVEAVEPKKKLIDVDRFMPGRGTAAAVPANVPGGRPKSRVEAEQPKGRRLVNTDRFDGVRTFSRDTWSEIKKVNWPDRETTRNLTLVVIAVSAILGIMLGGIDYVLFQLFEALP